MKGHSAIQTSARNAFLRKQEKLVILLNLSQALIFFRREDDGRRGIVLENNQLALRPQAVEYF